MKPVKIIIKLLLVPIQPGIIVIQWAGIFLNRISCVVMGTLSFLFFLTGTASLLFGLASGPEALKMVAAAFVMFLIDRYRKAVGLLMKVNGSKTVDHAALRSEFQDLTDDNAARNAELETVKDELKQLRSIRYYISKVVPEEAEPEKVDRLRAVITNVAHPDIRRQMFVLKEKIAEKLDDEEWAELFPQIQRNMAIMIAYDREAFFEKIREYKAEKEAAAFRERMDPDYEFKD